jgi:hypothetical protein
MSFAGFFVQFESVESQIQNATHQAAAWPNALERKGSRAWLPVPRYRASPAENVTGIDRSIAGRRVALTEALVADPRNDDPPSCRN